jgi:hypothetical protein
MNWKPLELIPGFSALRFPGCAPGFHLASVAAAPPPNLIKGSFLRSAILNLESVVSRRRSSVEETPCFSEKIASG